MRVLVAEDHAELANDIAEGLRDRGIAADVAYDGATAIQKGRLTPYDVILLDRDLPHVHGDVVCVSLRSTGTDARILMLTAATTIGDRVEGLNLGADDYLTKPFAFDELVARVHALARRAPATAPILTHEGITLDRARRRANRDGRELSLNRKEFGVLEALLLADGSAVSTETLLQNVWDENADPFTRTVTVTVARLRRKLANPDPIETLIGVGYPPAMSLRARLALLYAVLFLIAGGGLLGLSYGLLASRLPSTQHTVKRPSAALVKLCRAGKLGPPKNKLLTACTQDVTKEVNAASQNQRDQTLHTMLEVALVGLGVATLGSVVLGWFASGRVLRPTEAALASRQRFIANAAHELRTPLSAMRTALDVTLSKQPPATADQLASMAERVSRSVDQASSTVEALLTLSSAELTPRERATVDLATAAEDALDTISNEITERRLQLDTELEQAETLGDRVLIERLVGNLVDNAVRHNLDGGAITIRTRAADGFAEFAISNTGPEVDPDLLPKLFEPFARAERTSSTFGVGLGLSIAQAIANAHGATLSAAPRAGGGLDVTASFPR